MFPTGSRAICVIYLAHISWFRICIPSYTEPAQHLTTAAIIGSTVADALYDLNDLDDLDAIDALDAL